MKNKDLIDDLFARWAMWALAGNRSGLGFAMAGYAERIGSSYSVDNSPAPVDPDVLKADEAIRSLPLRHLTVVRVHYLAPGPAKRKAANLNMTRDAYYEYITHAKEFVAHILEGAAA